MEMKYAFVNGVILDGTQDMEPQSGKIILVDGEKITAIVDAGADTSGYEKIDLGGKYIMPGLINMHIHLPSSGKPKKKESDPKKLVKIMTSNNLFRKIIKAVCRSAAQMQLNSGVTTIRTVGGVVVLKKGCQCGWLPESFPETGMRAVFVISQAPDSAYVRIE